MTRRGFSLIELLVSAAIVAVLLGMLLTAVQKVRSVATRLRCTHNLKQNSLALHLYHDTENSFPNSMDPGNGPRPYLSWRAKILPYLEQDALWRTTIEAYRTQPNPFSPTRHAPAPQVVPVFACPADARTTTAWTLSGSNGPVALSSYLGVSGTASSEANGVFSPRSHTQILHITDGASQTLLLGERPPSVDLRYSWWYAGIGQGSGTVEHHMGVAERNRARDYHGCAPGPYRFGPGKLTEHCDAFHYWSLHDGGANFAFADGSVHFLKYAVAELLPALATRAGGETVGDFD